MNARLTALLNELFGDPEMDIDWMADAACRGTDPNLWFPLGRGRQSQETIATAKQICADCPVKAECLDYALTKEEGGGVWGGTSGNERRALRAAIRTDQQTAPYGHGTLYYYRRCTAGPDSSKCEACKRANAEHAARYRDRYRTSGGAA